jgi:RND family efflux transporter MFP subunit
MGERRSLCIVALVVGCGRAPTPPAAGHAAPATVAHRVAEGELTTVTLTPEAEARLAIETRPLVRRAVPRTRELGGEVVAPPGNAALLQAPVAGTVRAIARLHAAGTRVRRGDVLARLVPIAPVDRDLRAQASQLVASAAARLDVATARAARAATLAQDRAGSVRAAEEAAAEREIARASLAAARRRASQLGSSPLDADVSFTLRAPADGVVRQVLVSEGQAVAAGAPLFEITAVEALWVRVAVYAGDVAGLDEAAAAQVRRLSDAPGAAHAARPVSGPTTADPVASTLDVFYALEAGESALRVGERVIVHVPLRAAREAAVVPWSAVVFDVHGGAWVYEATRAHTFTRRRVEVERVEGDVAVLSRAPSSVTTVVSVGAPELFGTEFGAGH